MEMSTTKKLSQVAVDARNRKADLERYQVALSKTLLRRRLRHHKPRSIIKPPSIFD